MSDQGERRGTPDSTPYDERGDEQGAEQGDWWAQLYDADAPDTGRTRATDTLDDRYASIRATVTESVPETGDDADVEADLDADVDAPDGAVSSEAGAGAATPTRAAPVEASPEDASDEEPPAAPEPREPAAAPETMILRSPAATEPEPDTATESAASPEPEAPSAPATAPAPPTPAEPAREAEPATEAEPAQEAELATEAAPATEPAPEPEPRTRARSEGEATTGTSASPATVLLREPEAEGRGGSPTAEELLPAADPAALGELVADTVLDGARHGAVTLRAASVRGEAARGAGVLRGEALLTARFGAGNSAVVLIAVAAGSRTGPGAHRAAREACHSIGAAVGLSQARLAEDIRAGRREALDSGLRRLTDRTFGKLRAQAAALGLEPEEYTADLRCLLVPLDPGCRTRVHFGSGAGGLFRLRDGGWQDIDPRGARPAPGKGQVPDPRTPAPAPGAAAPSDDPAAGAAAARDGFTPRRDAAAPHADPFRFRASVARTGDVLMLCGPGAADLMRTAPDFAGHLADNWRTPPAPPAYLTHLTDPAHPAEDHTAATLWQT